MNARIIKETRVQLPVLWFVLACSAAVVYLGWKMRAAELGFENNHHTLGMLAGIYCVGCILTAALAFGNEFHHRTLSLLISQPVARRKLWREKMLVLAAFNAVVFLVILAAVLSAAYLEHGLSVNGGPFSDLVFVVFVPILCYCTAPYLTLLSKSTVGGVVFALFGAGMLLFAADIIGSRLLPHEFYDSFEGRRYIWGVNWLDSWLPVGELIYPVIFIPYAVALYWLGYKKFLRLEVIDSQAAELSLPAVLDAPLEKLSASFSSARAKLVFKELRLQRISFLIAAVFCVLVVAEFAGFRSKNMTSQNQFIFDGSIMIYLLFLPAIVGVTAVAEEKVWGLKDWHLTLPPSLRQQWRIKWLVALGLSFGLGAAFSFWLIHVVPLSKELDFCFWPLVIYCLFVTAVAMYAASITTSNLRAVLVTLGFMALFATMTAMMDIETSNPGSFFIEGVFITTREVYCGILWLLWNLIVCPVWWVTHSVEKTGRVAQWADISANNHVAGIFIAICVCALLWLILSLARANYRRSGLLRERVLLQLLALVILAAFMASCIISAHRLPTSFELPKWTLMTAPDAR